jgi:methanogenesis marker radical SAM protein
MRFANYRDQGLILGNEPIMEGVEPHNIQEFEKLVREINRDFNLRVTGTPVCDPENESPFALVLNKNHKYLDILSEVVSEATVVTGRISAPYIERVFELIGASDLVNVVPVEQDISCLITEVDLQNLDLKELKETVIIPGRAFVHDKRAEKILTRDGVDRIVARGPEKLTVDGEMSGTMSREDVLKRELIGFEDLIEAINFFGVRKR